MGVLGDIRAIGPLDRIVAEDEEVGIRETARDALAHLRDPNVPMRYIYHLPSQNIELTTSAEVYRIGEPVKIGCKVTGGEYGSQPLVEFFNPRWHFLPWGFGGPDPNRSQPFSMEMERRQGRRYDRVDAIRQLRPRGKGAIDSGSKSTDLYVDMADLGAISHFTLKRGESRLYEFADIRQAFKMTEPGEYRIHVSSYGFVLSNSVSIHIRPAANGPSSQP